MSWHYLPELAAVFLEPTCSDGAPSAQSKLTGIAKKFSSKGRETVCYHCSRFGTTSKPSTVKFGVAEWIASLPDSHANLSVLPESSEATRTNGTCGPKLSESFATFALDLDFSKMCPDSWASTDTLEPFSGAWPKSGMMSAGVAYLRPKLELLTSESDSGLKYPTPCAHQGGYNQGGGAGRSGKIRPTLPMMARKNLWPTPHGFSSDGKSNGPSGNELGRAVNESLKMWPTPQAHDAQKGYAERVGRFGTTHGGRNLNDEVLKWPTPRATDGTHGGRVTPRKSKEGGNLIEAVSSRTTWPTPTSRDHKDGTAQSCRNVPVNGLLGRAVHTFATPTVGDSKNARNATAHRNKIPPTGLHGGETLTDQVVPQGGSLNPDWVEWLMGWPLGWTDIDTAAARFNFDMWASSDNWWNPEPDVPRVASGVNWRVDRLKAIGNGQVPATLVAAWELLNSD